MNDQNNKQDPTKKPEKAWSERFPQKEYIRKEFTFTKNELLRLQVNTILLQKVQLEERVLKSGEVGIFDQEILPRNGFQPNPDYGIDYFIEDGMFLIYIPKFQCNKCNRKAKYQKDKLLWCERDFELQYPRKPMPPADGGVKSEVQPITDNPTLPADAPVDTTETPVASAEVIGDPPVDNPPVTDTPTVPEENKEQSN